MKTLGLVFVLLGMASFASAEEMPRPPEDLSKYESHVVCRDFTSPASGVTFDRYRLFALNEGYWNAEVLILTITSTGMQFKEEIVYSAMQMAMRGQVKRSAEGPWQIVTKEEYLKLFKENVPSQFIDGEGRFDFSKFSCATVDKSV
ncbi:MAG: hypothetical protein A3A32_03690 [Candidatus Wildermuthbacteria bacterium RIFCSPLOWO2_01_FULL_48_35]|uniref:Uncharacterized protein n=2 Tax=Parcubacteria group TaxID=1794811 RepID=A0A1G2RQ05_9BACT|nr:MAG: hypothetical protein UX72_C0003G0027 [Parcubacteria group bacterium GW2011_GWA2_47_10]OHA74923.1 MAG: hypothetical protein A3A32_03690 [Candidatus Wildermuthbacteria bacterium RIFCSPLOWO2_01_FULL_48_35]